VVQAVNLAILTVSYAPAPQLQLAPNVFGTDIYMARNVLKIVQHQVTGTIIMAMVL
jgi:hypothetical protein